jgi:hypothetical protein
MTQPSSTVVDLPPNTTPSVTNPHALKSDEVLSGLRSQRDGLSGAEAAERLKAVGQIGSQPRPKRGR